MSSWCRARSRAGRRLTFEVIGQATAKTFEPQTIAVARFMPDGESIVFSSARTGNVVQLFEIRSGTVEARSFGPPRTHLLFVSSKGELAVLTNARYIAQRLFEGTLARMSLEGSPRPWMEGVREADWSPDGSTLAIAHDVGSSDLVTRRDLGVGADLYAAAARALSHWPRRAGPAQSRGDCRVPRRNLVSRRQGASGCGQRASKTDSRLPAEHLWRRADAAVAGRCGPGVDFA